MSKICDLSIDKAYCISPTIDTSVLVLTDERIAHIAENHPGDYERYGRFIPEVVEKPNFIMRDPKYPNTGIYVKHIKTEPINLRLTVRYHTQEDSPSLSNSILSFQQIRDQEFRRLRKKVELIVYTDERICYT